MRYSIGRLILVALTLTLLLSPTAVVYGLDFSKSIVPCGWDGAHCFNLSDGHDKQGNPTYLNGKIDSWEMCNFTDFVNIVGSIVTGTVILISVYAAISFMYAGYAYLTSGGSQDKVSYAKSIFYKVLVGYIIILTAWLIIYEIEQSMFSDEMKKKSILSGAPGITGDWWEVRYGKSCREGGGNTANQPSTVTPPVTDKTKPDTSGIPQVGVPDQAQTQPNPVVLPPGLFNDPDCEGTCDLNNQSCARLFVQDIGEIYKCLDNKPLPPPPPPPTPVTYNISVTKTGSGSGIVKSSGGSINCGSACDTTAQSGTSVSLSATADSRSVFAGWSGPCSGTGVCQFALDADTLITADFGKKTYLLSVSKSGAGNGTVTSSDGSINCGSTCSKDVVGGEELSLNAEPAGNSTFAGFKGGGCKVSGNTCTWPSGISADAAVVAVFSAASISCHPQALSGQDISSANVGESVIWHVDNVPQGASVAHYYWGALIPGATIAGNVSGEGQDLSSSFSTAGLKQAFGQIVFQDGEFHGYSCSVEIKSPNVNLSVGMSGTGTGSVSGALSCNKPTADTNFCPGSGYSVARVSLSASPGTGSTFAGWTFCDSVSGTTCYIDLKPGNNHVDAAFQR